MPDALAKLPRLPAEVLGPCAICRTPILGSVLPIFYRVTVQQVGVDADALRRHIGVAMMLGAAAGGLALASAMGAGDENRVAVEMAKGTINLCHACSSADPARLNLVALALEATGDEA